MIKDSCSSGHDKHFNKECHWFLSRRREVFLPKNKTLRNINECLNVISEITDTYLTKAITSSEYTTRLFSAKTYWTYI